MTGSAAALEDWTRWLGVALAVVGALLANPAATDHALRATGREVVAGLRRMLPKRGQRTRRVGTDRATTWAIEAAHVERTYDADEWADADAEGRLGILAARTASLNQEVADLYTLVSATRQDLSDQISEAVKRLSAEVTGLRDHVDGLQDASVRFDASALPLIVVGVVLADLSSDAEKVQMWAWILGLVAALTLCWWSTRRVLRTWPRN
ncbi:hypothetical protein [Knoellia aerolata]|uniref:hypothetical protein n=1 Tax=Knoellia aerolata TaxID=442954 RepID=UPI0012EECD38|nr:hypothetical protein [Knoellia aerolata]